MSIRLPLLFNEEREMTGLGSEFNLVSRENRFRQQLVPNINKAARGYNLEEQNYITIDPVFGISSEMEQNLSNVPNQFMATNGKIFDKDELEHWTHMQQMHRIMGALGNKKESKEDILAYNKDVGLDPRLRQALESDARTQGSNMFGWETEDFEGIRRKGISEYLRAARTRSPEEFKKMVAKRELDIREDELADMGNEAPIFRQALQELSVMDFTEESMKNFVNKYVKIVSTDGMIKIAARMDEAIAKYVYNISEPKLKEMMSRALNVTNVTPSGAPPVTNVTPSGAPVSSKLVDAGVAGALAAGGLIGLVGRNRNQHVEL